MDRQSVPRTLRTGEGANAARRSPSRDRWESAFRKPGSPRLKPAHTSLPARGSRKEAQEEFRTVEDALVQDEYLFRGLRHPSVGLGLFVFRYSQSSRKAATKARIGRIAATRPPRA